MEENKYLQGLKSIFKKPISGNKLMENLSENA